MHRKEASESAKDSENGQSYDTLTGSKNVDGIIMLPQLWYLLVTFWDSSILKLIGYFCRFDLIFLLIDIAIAIKDLYSITIRDWWGGGG